MKALRSLAFFALIMPTEASTGWWTDFCQRHLVAEDPQPFADYSFDSLIEIYFNDHDTKCLDEILYRLRAGLLTPDQEALFWEKFK